MKSWKDIKEGEDYEILRSSCNNPTAQIWMGVYNHSKYLCQAIDSILQQRTEYQYEVFIVDDFSTDDSWKIIKDYYERFSDRITVFRWNYNTYGSELQEASGRLFINAKYVAFLEGDDYWTDMNKIQKQVSFLDNHPEYIGITGNVRNVNEDGTKQHRDSELYCYMQTHVVGRENVLNRERLSHISALMCRNIWSNWTDAEYRDFVNCSMNGDIKYIGTVAMEGNVLYSSDIYGDHRRVFTGESWTAVSHRKDMKAEIQKMWEDFSGFLVKKYGSELNPRRYLDNNELKKDLIKQKNIVRLYDMWMAATERGRSISKLLMKKGIQTVVIYGMSMLGGRLYHELKSCGQIDVMYGFEQNERINVPGLKLYRSIDGATIKPDVVIVTALTTYDDIYRALKEQGYKKIMSIDELLYEMYQEA